MGAGRMQQAPARGKGGARAKGFLVGGNQANKGGGSREQVQKSAEIE